MAPPTEKEGLTGIRIVHTPAGAGPEIDSLAAALKSISPQVSVRAEETGTYGAWEWLLPAAVMVYVGKGFIDGFLAEIGAGTARALESALLAAFRKGKGSGGRWMTLEQMREHLARVDAGGEGTSEINAIRRSGTEIVPLRISAELPNGIEARFVFPADLDEHQVRQALNELKSVLPLAFARDQRRAELLALQCENSDEAMQIALSDARGAAIMYREATYVYDMTRHRWMDADEALQLEIRTRLNRKQESETDGSNHQG